MLKKLLIGFVIAVALVGAVGMYYVFIYSVNHHRDVKEEIGISITANDLATAYQQNEVQANMSYLNKAVLVKGLVISVDKDQSGKTTLLLGDEASLSNVFITLKEVHKIPQKGDTVMVKGVCSGFLSDVVVADAVIEE